MKTEFLFKQLPRGQLMGLSDLERQMDDIIAKRLRGDFAFMDRRMVEVYDKRQADKKAHPPLRSLGRMPISVVLQKFK